MEWMDPNDDRRRKVKRRKEKEREKKKRKSRNNRSVKMNVPTQMFAAGLSRPIHQTMKIICLGQQGTRRDKLQQKTEAIRPLGACGATVSIGSTTLDWYISPVKAFGEIKNRLHAPVFGVREFPLCAPSTRGNGRFEIRAEFGREDLYSDLSYSELNSFDFENSILPRTKLVERRSI